MAESVKYADPLGTLPTDVTSMVGIGDRRVLLATFNVAYGSAPTNPFKGHLQGGQLVIAQFTDVTHVYTLQPGGATETIY